MHILLGGLSSQYANMYTRAMAVVKTSLYFRPMSPKGGDILLTGSLFASEPTTRTPNILKSESSHLTCFVGGWVGLGAKTFERGNLEIEEARRLTYGCIWAYESTRTGIMPESFDVIACEDMGHCEWNETAWRLALDPMARTRDPTPSPSLPLSQVESIGDDVGVFDDLDDLDERDVPGEKRRRQFEETFDSTSGKLDAGGASAQPGSYEHVKSASASSSTSTSVQPVYSPPPPPTHDEYVNNRIHDERLPPGFTLISDRRYILRPEAIESVFVMCVSSFHPSITLVSLIHSILAGTASPPIQPTAPPAGRCSPRSTDTHARHTAIPPLTTSPRNHPGQTTPWRASGWPRL